MRQYTPEFLESAVNLILIKGLSARKAAENLGIPIHTTHSWVASARRGTGGLTTQQRASQPYDFANLKFNIKFQELNSQNQAHFLNDWLKQLRSSLPRSIHEVHMYSQHIAA